MNLFPWFIEKLSVFFDNWKRSKGEITYNVVLDLAFCVVPCFFFTWVICPSRFQKFTALRKTCNFLLEITWGQFNKTFTSVIYKCSYCFRVWKQFTLVKVLLNWLLWACVEWSERTTTINMFMFFRTCGDQFLFQVGWSAE